MIQCINIPVSDGACWKNMARHCTNGPWHGLEHLAQHWMAHGAFANDNAHAAYMGETKTNWMVMEGLLICLAYL